MVDIYINDRTEYLANMLGNTTAINFKQLHKPKDSIVIVEILDPQRDIIIEECLSRGCSVIVNNLFEQTREWTGPGFHLTGNWFFWAHEAILNRKYNRADAPTFSINKQRLALMPMGRKRDFRTLALSKFKPFLHNMFWSYRDLGTNLPHNETTTADRDLQPLWYTDTFCSVVCETSVLDPLFITEKTFKPIAYQHPFLLLGGYQLLAALRDQGFATFDNIFDESYDDQIDFNHRLEIVYNNLQELDQRKLSYDQETRNRLAHNRELFNDPDRIKQIVTDEVVNPILEYAETR